METDERTHGAVVLSKQMESEHSVYFQSTQQCNIVIDRYRFAALKVQLEKNNCISTER
jgi:hypothetical protein